MLEEDTLDHNISYHNTHSFRSFTWSWLAILGNHLPPNNLNYNLRRIHRRSVDHSKCIIKLFIATSHNPKFLNRPAMYIRISHFGLLWGLWDDRPPDFNDL